MYEESKRFGCCEDGVVFGMEYEEGSRKKAMKERLVVAIVLALVHFESLLSRAITPECAAVNIFYLIFYI